jgi:hypothetical protein
MAWTAIAIESTGLCKFSEIIFRVFLPGVWSSRALFSIRFLASKKLDGTTNTALAPFGASSP